MKIITEAPGKLILLGEYAVLEGAPALVSAVNRFARVSITSTNDDQFAVEAPAIDIPLQKFLLDKQGKIKFLGEHSKKLEFFISIFEYTIRKLLQKNISPIPMRISLDTSEFFLRKGAAKLGLGSSAALTVALMAGLFAFYGEDQTIKHEQTKLFKNALHAHRRAQGNTGSGIDIAACVFGGNLHYKLLNYKGDTPAEIQSIQPLSDIYFLPIWTGKASSTSALVNHFFAFKEKNGNRYRILLDELSELSGAGCIAYAQRNTSEFLDTVRLYYNKMKEIGSYIDAPVVSPEHQKIGTYVYDFGGVYKPSGAGGGDLGIAFVRSAQEMTELASAVQKSGFEIVHLNMNSNGINIQTI